MSFAPVSGPEAWTRWYAASPEGIEKVERALLALLMAIAKSSMLLNSSVTQVCQPDGEVIITNDGATILNKMRVMQPAAKMLVELSKSQV